MPSIAILGASSDRRKFGNRAVRGYLRQGYTVYPIHPTEKQIEGLPAYPSIRYVPVEAIDRVSVYLPPNVGLKVLPELTSKKIGEVFFNPGADAPEVLEQARALGLNVVVGCSLIAVGISPSELED